MRLPLVMVAVLGLVAPAVAASWVAPVPFITASSDRSTYARFVPPAAQRRATGTVFRLNADGTEAVLWQVDWYSPGVEVSSNGDLVRLAPITRPNPGYLDAPALYIYPRGQLKPRVYSIGELVENHSRLECDDESGVLWRAYVPPVVIVGNTYRVVTVEGVEVAFDTTTGSILGTRQLEPGHFSATGLPRCVSRASGP